MDGAIFDNAKPVEEVIARIERDTPVEIRNIKVEVRPLTKEEGTTKERLHRALPPEFRRGLPPEFR